MKRLFIGLATAIAISLSALLVGYFSFPTHFAQPLLSANRALSGLSEKTVAVGPHTVHYLEGGSGETLVLLHGIFARPFSAPLIGRYRVIAPDLPGFGESSRLEGEAYDYAAQTERLKALLDALGVRRAHLMGSSMGGTIAALFAIAHPERVASVVLVGAPHGIRTPKPSRMDALIEAGQAPLIARNPAEFEAMMSLLFSQRPFLPAPILQAAQQDALRNAASNQRLWAAQLKDRYLLGSRITALTRPTLVLWGGADKLFDSSGAALLRDQLKTAQVNAEVEVLAGVGHLPMMEAPRATALRVAEFLRAQSK